MTTTDDVLEIERGLWTDGPDAYHRHLDDVCLTAIGATAGVFTRNDVAAMVADGPRWQDLEIDVRGVVEPTDDVAILTYEARAVRGEDERYRALVSSGYVRRNGGWKVIFHQQTPLADE